MMHLKSILVLLFATLIFGCSERERIVETTSDLNSDIPEDGYKPVPPTADGPLRPPLAVAEPDPKNRARVRLVVGGLLSPGGAPISYSRENVTVIEDDVVQGWIVGDTGSEPLQADIVIVVDNTTSMSGAIAGVRSSMLAFIEALEASGQDIRLGVVAFNDELLHPNIFATHENGVDSTDVYGDACVFSQFDLTQDLGEDEALAQYVAGLRVDSFGVNSDYPELCFGAVDYARRTFNWREGAQHIYIAITDDRSWGRGALEPNLKGIDDEYPTDLSLAQSLEGAVVHTFCPPRSENLPLGTYNVSTLSEETGGTWTRFSSQLDLTALPIIDVTAASVALEFVKGGDAETVRSRALRVVVEIEENGATHNGERSLVLEY